MLAAADFQSNGFRVPLVLAGGNFDDLREGRSEERPTQQGNDGEYPQRDQPSLHRRRLHQADADGEKSLSLT